VPVVHLNRYYHFTELMRDPRIQLEVRRHRSAHDQTPQTTLILRPAGPPSDQLFFFFHGMDGDSGDAVIVRDLVTAVGAMVVTPGGRGPAWVSSPFLADAEQIIREHGGGRGFYLTGVSMGGTQALALAGLLPEDLRAAVRGVVALLPGTDLPAIAARSGHERIRRTLLESVAGDAAALRQRSPSQLLACYRSSLPFVLFSRRDDTLLLAPEQAAFVAQLRERGHPVVDLSAPGDHDFTFESFDFGAALEKLGRDATELSAPLRTAPR
jgi:pimeloyl-ACP methyl ester carboxylesterase